MTAPATMDYLSRKSKCGHHFAKVVISTSLSSTRCSSSILAHRGLIEDRERAPAPRGHPE